MTTGPHDFIVGRPLLGRPTMLTPELREGARRAGRRAPGTHNYHPHSERRDDDYDGEGAVHRAGLVRRRMVLGAPPPEGLVETHRARAARP